MAQSDRRRPAHRNKALDSYQIGRSLPCLSCQYDLRGLSYSHHCPECGKSAAITIEHVLKSEATATKVEHLRQGLSLTSASWGLYALLLVACLAPSCTLIVLAIAPLMRLGAIISFRKVEGALPAEWPVSLGTIGGLAIGTLSTTILFLAFSATFPGAATLLMGIFFIIMVGIEGFVWMSTLGQYARDLEAPLIGPVASIARISWIPIPIITAILFAASIGLSSKLIDNLAQLSLIVGFGFCGVTTAIVTQLFSDIIRQLEIVGVLKTQQDPILVWPSNQSPPPEEAPNLDVAKTSNTPISLSEPEQPLRDPGADRDQRGTEPNNPTGLY